MRAPPSWLNHLPKVKPKNITTVGARLQPRNYVGEGDTAYCILPLITPKFMFFSHAKYIYSIPTPPKELTDSSINSRVWSPKLHLNLTLFKSPLSEIGSEIHPEANSSPAVKWRDLAVICSQNTKVGHGQERHYHSNREKQDRGKGDRSQVSPTPNRELQGSGLILFGWMLCLPGPLVTSPPSPGRMALLGPCISPGLGFWEAPLFYPSGGNCPPRAMHSGLVAGVTALLVSESPSMSFFSCPEK